MMYTNEEKYSVKNKFLKAVMGNFCSRTELGLELDIRGLTHGKGVGSAILTYLVRKTFNIQRLPFCEDRHFAVCSGDGILNYHEKENLKKLLENDEFINNIDEMVEELKHIYSLTQKKLNKDYPKQDHVELIRNVEGGYAAILYELKNKAKETSSSHVKIETDTVDCYTDNPGTYYKDVHFTINIPKKDILYYYELFDRNFSSEVLIENYEFIVINSDSRGLRQIPTKAIEKSNKNFNEYSYITKPILENNQYIYIRGTSNDFANFEKAKLKPSFQKVPSLFCIIVERFLKNCKNK